MRVSEYDCSLSAFLFKLSALNLALRTSSLLILVWSKYSCHFDWNISNSWTILFISSLSTSSKWNVLMVFCSNRFILIWNYSFISFICSMACSVASWTWILNSMHSSLIFSKPLFICQMKAKLFFCALCWVSLLIRQLLGFDRFQMVAMIVKLMPFY